MTTCTENPVSSFRIKASPTPAITNKIHGYASRWKFRNWEKEKRNKITNKEKKKSKTGKRNINSETGTTKNKIRNWKNKFQQLEIETQPRNLKEKKTKKQKLEKETQKGKQRKEKKNIQKLEKETQNQKLK